MKRNHALRRIAALAAALLLTFSLAAGLAEESAYELDNGVAWDTTISQMKEIHGVTDDEDLNIYAVGEFTQYSFLRPAEADRPVTYVYYIFKNEQLVMYGTRMISSGDDQTALFDAQYTLLSARYGEPADQDKAWFVGIFDILEGGTLTQEQLVGYEAWALGGGTKLCLANVDNQIVVHVYINEPAMTSEAD